MPTVNNYTYTVIGITPRHYMRGGRKSGPIGITFNSFRALAKTRRCTKFHQNMSTAAACRLNTRKQKDRQV